MNHQKMSRRQFASIAASAGLALALDGGRINALAAKIQPKKDYPIVIIGAGMGGLTCGALLAQKGFPVTIVEQHNIPGGYATSFDRAAGKFTFEVSLHRTSLSPDTLQVLKELGVLKRIALAEIPNNKRIITPSGNVRIPAGSEQNINYLNEKYPHEREGLKKYLAEVQKLHDELAALKNNKGRPDFPVQYPALWNIRDKTLAAYMDGFFKDPALKESLASDWASFGLPPSKLGAFIYVIASSTMREKQYYIKDRSQDLSYALAEIIQGHGGKVLYKTPVEKILFNNNAVAGIATTKGKRLPARIVVSNASAITTMQKMLPANALPADYLERINKLRPSISSFVVWLGLKGDITETIKDTRIVIYSGNGAEADYQASLVGDVENLSLSTVFYDNYYKGYSRPGTSTVTIVTMSGYKPWQRFAADYKAGNKAAYRKEKQRWVDIILNKVEQRALPGLAAMIEVKEAATPLTNWRYTGNNEGAIYGFEQSVDNCFLGRVKNRVPLQGLYLAGAWGNPGGGYGGAIRGGEQTFKKILEDWA
jgi:phytoene dehydrogenase-like protein